MNIVVEIPPNLPDAMQCTAQEFSREARLAMAASLAGVSRVEFLLELHRFGVPVIDLPTDELAADLDNA